MILSEDDYYRLKKAHVAKLRFDAKRRAKDKGVPFDVDTDYLMSIAPEYCPIFKVKLQWAYIGDRTSTDDRPSLDRIIPDRGYVKGNVAWISFKANRIKADGDETDLYKVADWLHEKRKEVERGGAIPPIMDDPAFAYITHPSNPKVVNDEATRDRGEY